MKKTEDKVRKQPWHKKPAFGGLYNPMESRYIYISFNYFKQRLRFPTDKEDCAKNWEELSDFLYNVGQKIKNNTFVFAKAFYWLDETTKAHFTKLEGGDYKPEPQHVLFGEYATEWMELKIPNYVSVTKQRYYRGALVQRVIPYFQKHSFGSITASVISTFIDEMKRTNGDQKGLSTKRIKSIIGPMSKVWEAACNDKNWNLKNPFSDISTKYKELEDKAAQDVERKAALMADSDEDVTSDRDVFLLSEWLRLRHVIDRHYHPVMELLLMGMIGSELEALQKRHIKDNAIHIRCSVVRDTGGKMYMKYKPKNWYRKRDIPLTVNIKKQLEYAAAQSTSDQIMHFESDIDMPGNVFLLTMKDGSFFNYTSFRTTVWNVGIKKAGLTSRVPYAARHTFVQWSLLIGVAKSRLVDLMGHSNKKMVDEIYGKYRQGLVDERERILDYLGENFLALEELRTYFPDRYRKAMDRTPTIVKTEKAPEFVATFGQSLGQRQGLYADNYL